MIKYVGHYYSLDELKFVEIMDWDLYHISSILGDDPKQPVTIKILMMTFGFSFTKGTKPKTKRRYICKEFEQFQKKRLMRLIE